MAIPIRRGNAQCRSGKFSFRGRRTIPQTNCCHTISLGRWGFTRARWHRVLGLLNFPFVLLESLKTLGAAMACLSTNLTRFLGRLLGLALLTVSLGLSFRILAPFALSFGTLLALGPTFPSVRLPTMLALRLVSFASLAFSFGLDGIHFHGDGSTVDGFGLQRLKASICHFILSHCLLHLFIGDSLFHQESGMNLKFCRQQLPQSGNLQVFSQLLLGGRLIIFKETFNS